MKLLSERIIRKSKVGKALPMADDTKAIVVKDIIHEHNNYGDSKVGSVVKVLATIPGDSVVHILDKDHKQLSSGDTQDYTTYLVSGVNKNVSRTESVNVNDVILLKFYDKDGNEYIGEDIFSEEELEFLCQ